MKKIFILFALLALPMSSFAATQGSKGEKSEATSVITLKIPEMIIANGFADVTLDVNLKTLDTPNQFPEGSANYTKSDTICVASNNSRSGNNEYSLVVTSSNNTGSSDYFVVDSGGTAGNKVYFDLKYSDGATTQSLVQNQASSTSYVAHTSLISCDGGSPTDNATYTVTFTDRSGTTGRPSIDMVPAGVYTTTLTFLFTPNNESDNY
ncbi:MAG: hypothetical protein ACOX3T_07580 [Bdellovibrionota bacterium]